MTEEERQTLGQALRWIRDRVERAAADGCEVQWAILAARKDVDFHEGFDFKVFIRPPAKVPDCQP